MSTNERVDTLENALKELAYAGRRTEMSIDRLTEHDERTDAKLDRFVEHTDATMAELSVALEKSAQRTDAKLDRFVEHTDAKLDHFIEHTDATIADLSAELKKQVKWSNDRWGKLANKMGTFVEDMILPNFPHILERYFGTEEVDDLLVRRVKPHPTDRSKRKEFDLIAWTEETVYWVETKSNSVTKEFSMFVRDNESVFEYFPELRGKKLVKIVSALSMSAQVLSYLTKRGCYAMMLGEETMDIVNYEAVANRGRRRSGGGA